MPSINSVIEVTTRYKTNMFFADKKGYQTFTKKGKVVVAPKGASADSFALQHDYLSVINLGKVINMKILKGNSIDIQSFIVKGKGGKYQVIKNKNEFSCTCIGFKYHNKCKHITEIKESL